MHKKLPRIARPYAPGRDDETNAMSPRAVERTARRHLRELFGLGSSIAKSTQAMRIIDGTRRQTNSRVEACKSTATDHVSTEFGYIARLCGETYGKKWLCSGQLMQSTTNVFRLYGLPIARLCAMNPIKECRRGSIAAADDIKARRTPEIRRTRADLGGRGE